MTFGDDPYSGHEQGDEHGAPAPSGVVSRCRGPSNRETIDRAARFAPVQIKNLQERLEREYIRAFEVSFWATHSLTVICAAKPVADVEARICPQVRMDAGLSLGSGGREAASPCDQRAPNRSGQGFCWDYSRPVRSPSHPLARLAEQS